MFVLKVYSTQMFVLRVVGARMGAEHARARHWPRGVTEAAGCAGVPPPPPRAPRRGKAAPAPSHRYSDCDDNVPIYVFGHG